MQEFTIDCSEAAIDFLDYAKDQKNITFQGNIIKLPDMEVTVEPEFSYVLDELKPSKYQNALIYGKDRTERVVAIEINEDKVELFLNDGTIKNIPNTNWLLTEIPASKSSKRLEGDLHYKWLFQTQDTDYYKKVKGALWGKKVDMYSIYDPTEAAMHYHGITLFKGLKVQDVSVLSFDIETTGITHNENSRVLMISNTYRDSDGHKTKKLFSLDDYEHDAAMIKDWTEWVQGINPTVMVGHNIFAFDLPYLSYRYAQEYPGDLPLGRDGSSINYSTRTSKFRKDGSQEYDYHNAKIYGRHIIDTFFLAIKYDFSRKYDSYGLKPIIEAEGLEKKNRIKWDFEKNKPWDTYVNGGQLWEDFKKYGKDDADDSLALYDLMIPSYFYYMQSLPMSFQTMNNTATGRQVNGILVRAYLQEGHSVPKASDHRPYQGAISFGVPGVYSHVYKVDVASLYPSIMITEKIYNPEKDPKAYFYEMVKTFTEERLDNKAKAKETGDRYYKDMEQSQKIVINSAYGLLGTSGLNFNYFDGADKVTGTGREILQTGINWVCGKNAIQTPELLKNGQPKLTPKGNPKLFWELPDGPNEGMGFSLVNVDTDSFSYSPGKKLKAEEFEEHISKINSLYKDGIRWEDDGYFKKVLVVKSKNYVLDEGKKLKIKGSALKGVMKEKALQEMLNDVIIALLGKKRDHIFHLYQRYANEIKSIEDINRWTMKKTITKAVLNPERKQEQKILDAVSDIHIQEGDKVRLFSIDGDTLARAEQFDGTYDKNIYFQKLHDTLDIFSTLIDTSLFPNYKTGRNKDLI